jgi:hypothetical protein
MASVMAKRQRMFTVLLSALVAAPSISGQAPRIEEVKAHFQESIREAARKQHADPAAIGRLEAAFFGTGEDWDKKSAADRLADGMRQQEFGLAFEKGSFEILNEPLKNSDAELFLGTSSLFVDSVSSVIRRYSVLDEIGPVVSKELNHNQLRAYLKDTMKVPDYVAVTNSFDPAFRAEVVTFKEPTTLLRLYGGESRPIGRYFFCCLWPTDISGGEHRVARKLAGFWSDASGLATPPENLLNHLAVATIPEGTTAVIGIVADNFPDAGGHFRRGGNAQILVPEVKTFPFEEYSVAGHKGEVTEIEIQSDDRSLWFRK